MGSCAAAKNAENPYCLVPTIVKAPALRGAQQFIKLIIYWFSI